ncbi:MAG: flavodoxin domain-containing protein [Limnochordia bacterium]|nr:flavodoxin domain-containing protein [Limnochordia bacterium]
MKVLIAYASKFGCTEKCAMLLKEKLSGADVTVVDLARGLPSDLQRFDTIVIGGPIYAGNLEAPVKRFCEENADTLRTKKLALFLCCGNGEQFEAQLNGVFDRQLIDHAVASEHFGYAYQLEKIGFFFRIIVRLIAKVRQSESHILSSNIARLAVQLADSD